MIHKILSYYIDNRYRVWSLYTDKSLLLTPSKTIYGYLQYGIKGRSVRAHRFIWEYFKGKIPKTLQINHINGIKTDNRLENLELVTAKENIKHSLKLGLKVPKKKLTELKRHSIRKKYKTGRYSNKDLARVFKVSPSTIRNIIHFRH